MEPPASAEAGGWRVFVSYARADKARVQPIVEALNAQGCEVWWDSHIRGGAVFAREIEAELNAAHAVIVVWSAVSVESDWVRDEAAVARDRGRLVPVRIDLAPPPLGFGQYHAVDLTGWSGYRNAAPFRQLI